MERSAADDKITVLFYFTHCTNTQQHPLGPMNTFILVPQWSLSPVPCTATHCPSYSLRHFPTQSPPQGPTVASMEWPKPHTAWEGGPGGKWPGGEAPSASLQPLAAQGRQRWSSLGLVNGMGPFIPDGIGTSDIMYGTPVFSRLLSQVEFSPGSVKVTNPTMHGSTAAGVCPLHSPSHGSGPAPALYLTRISPLSS